MWIKIDETDEPFVSDKIIEYLRQWVHITDEGKEAIQCSQKCLGRLQDQLYKPLKAHQSLYY